MQIFHPVFLKIFIIFLLLPLIAESQSDTSNNSNSSKNIVRVTPGKEYDVNWINRIFSGEHWRDLWSTEINAEVLNLEKFAGGLYPLKQGGGLQTKSLRLKGNDNNEYKFRSIHKYPYKSLPPEWQDSYYGKLLQDQVSIGLPVSSLIVYPLMKEVGILAVEPKIVVLPHDKRLGSFEKDFGGQLGILELNPNAGKKGINNFADADKVVNGFKIFKEVEKDNDEQVDQTEFLKARLMDIFLGDRDRHADQWQWAGYKSGKERIWKPIPRDRDYAFGKYDGFFPWVSGVLAHSLVGFSEDIPQITEITWTGRHLDRRFLNELDKPVWDSIAVYLAGKLTNEILKNAVKKMPPEMYKIGGKVLYEMLKNRRIQIKQATDDFYEIYSDVVDVYGSNKKEFTEVEVLNEKEVEVRLYKKDKDADEKKGEPFYKRKFNTDYTSEVRIHLLKGDDYTLIKGNPDNGILIRVISDDGKDKLVDKSNVTVKVYDSDKNTFVKSINGVYINNDIVQVPSTPIHKYEPELEDRYGFWAFTPVLNYNTDDGFILGGGPNYEQFGFRADPYLYYLQLTGAYATAADDYDVEFYADFNKLIHNSRVQFFLSASELDYNRYYGFGNQTERNPELAEEKYYRANQQNIIFMPSVSTYLNKNFTLNTSAFYRYSNVEQKNNSDNLIGEDQPYGFGKISDLGLSAGFTFDNLDNHINSKKGFYSNLNFTYFPNVFDLKNDFSKVYGNITGYFTVKTFTDLTLILNAGGEKVFGNYIFYEAAAVGGQSSIRGYSRERFQGDASLFGQSELRIKIADVNFFLPAKIGMSGLSDVGRVFLAGENSEQWHSTWGGGLWFEIVKAAVANFTVAFSSEVTKYYFTFGFGF